MSRLSSSLDVAYLALRCFSCLHTPINYRVTHKLNVLYIPFSVMAPTRPKGHRGESAVICICLTAVVGALFKLHQIVGLKHFLYYGEVSAAHLLQ